MARLYSNEQIALANSVNLVDFLKMQGEKLIKSGKDMRWERNHSVTLRDNRYYKWKEGEGGYPIQFLKEFYNFEFKQAMEVLLSSVGDVELVNSLEDHEEVKKPFAAPEKNDNNKRAYAYLNKTRLIDKEVLNYFFNNNLIYEDKKYHNAVFIGLDEDGIIRHAHKRSTIPYGKSYRGNVESSDSRYPFHYNGTSNKVFVFEAPIDMLSFITLNKDNWQEHSYIALNGLGTEGLDHLLDSNKNLKLILLCLDHDVAGIEATERVTDLLHEKGYCEVGIIQSVNKDFNEDLKEINGKDFKLAEENPKYEELDRAIKEIQESITFKDLQEHTDYQTIAKSFAELYYSSNSNDCKDVNVINQKVNDLIKKILIAEHQIIYYDMPFYRESQVFDNLKEDYRAYKDKGNLKNKLKDIMEDLKIIRNGEATVQNYKKLSLDALYLKMGAEREMVRNMKQEQSKLQDIQKEKPEAKIIGADGNIFNIMSISSNALKDAGLEKESEEMLQRVTNSHSYDEALRIIMEYIEPAEVCEEHDCSMEMKGY